MTLINLKFSPEMEQAIMEGKKCCTTRDEPKGDVGDIFILNCRAYRLIRIESMDVNCVPQYYDLEGFDHEFEFVDILNAIYPYLTIGSTVWVHFFAYVEDVEE